MDLNELKGQLSVIRCQWTLVRGRYRLYVFQWDLIETETFKSKGDYRFHWL